MAAGQGVTTAGIGGANTSASQQVAITPDDNTDLPANVRAIYVGSGGNITLILSGDTDAVQLVAVSTGAILPVLAKRVKSTGTTASSLVAWF